MRRWWLSSVTVGLAVLVPLAALAGEATRAGIDTVTEPPTLTLPASSSTQYVQIEIAYTLPELALAGSVSLTFDDGLTTPVVLTLVDDQMVSFAWDPTTDPVLLPEVTAATAGSLAYGTYAVTLSYQDIIGNPAATDTATGVTISPTPDCDDANPCTDDAFDNEGGQCVHTPVSGPCDDGLFCTATDACSNGECVGSGNPCVDDGVVCTVDGCDEVGDACTYTPSDAACDDGVACNGAETCDAMAGCQAGAPPDCASLDDSCGSWTCTETAAGCEQTPVQDGTGCDDGNACTVADACASGACEALNGCAVPLTHALLPSASDALFVLQASVGIRLCALCLCDVNGSGGVSATDGLATLRLAVGQPGDRLCPTSSPTTTTTTVPSTTSTTTSSTPTSSTLAASSTTSSSTTSTVPTSTSLTLGATTTTSTTSTTLGA